MFGVFNQRGRFYSGLISVVLLLSSCGGGTTASTGSGTTPSAGSLSAYVVDGPVSNASCALYDPFAITLSPIVSGTSANGKVSFTGIPASYQNFWMFVQCVGGSYVDEATGKTITLPATSGQEAIFQYIGTSTGNVVVSPLTSIAFAKTLTNSGIIADYPLQLRQTAILLGLGNVDISSTQPIDVTSKTADGTVAGQYGIVLAVLSEMMADKPATYPDLAALVGAISTGISGGMLGNTVRSDMKTALTNYSSNPLNKFVSPSLMAASSTMFTNLSNGNAVGLLTTQANYASKTITTNTTGSGLGYGLPITATGGTPPYHYQFDTFANGSPPPGLSVNLVSGELNGMPTVAGTYHFGVCAVDLAGASSCTQIQMTVTAATTTPTPPSSSTYYWANWSCGSSAACASLMGGSSGSAGPMCASSDCSAWGNKFIVNGYACSTTANSSNKTTGTPSNGLCWKSGVDF